MQAFIDFVNNNQWFYFLPTLLFILIILIAVLIGMKRGAIKSTHKFIIMAISLGISIGVFYTLIANDGKILYDISSGVLSMFNTSFEKLTGFKPIEENMKGVVYPIIVDYVAKNLGGPEQMAVEIYAQLDVWTQVACKVFTFVVCIVCYILISLLLNIFDWIFFRKKKRVKKFKRTHSGAKYKNHSLTGGVVGGLYGAVVSLIIFSFLGLTLFALDTSSRENNKLSFKDPTLSNVYDISNMTNKLGNTGILKLLNQFKDSNNMPFYLFFANEIFSGEAVDYNGDKYIVYAAKEFRSYAGLAKDLMDVLAKHGGDKISMEILQNTNPDQTYEVLMNLFSKEEFNNDLINIIDKYQATEYLKNITKISVATVGRYFDDIITKLYPNNANQYITMYDAIFGVETDPYYIGGEDIVTYEDTKNLLKGVVSSVPKILDLYHFTSNNSELSQSDPTYYKLNLLNYSLESFNSMVPYLNELTMFKGTDNDTREVKIQKIDKMNRLYDRVVDYSFTLVKDSEGNSFENPYKGHNIKWNEEFFNLSTTVEDILGVNIELINEHKVSKKPMLEVFNDVFSKDYKNKQIVDDAYFGLADKAGKFESISILLDSEFFYSMYEGMLTKVTNTEVKIPRNIKWGNDGETKGELYTSLNIIRDMLAEEALEPYLKDRQLQDLNTFKEILLKLNTPYENGTLLEHMFNSNLVYYSSSAVLSNLKVGTFEMYVPYASKVDVDGIMMAKKTELVSAVKVLPIILDNIKDLNVIKDDPLILTDVISLPNVKDSVIGSDIIAATMSKTVFNLTTTNQNLKDTLRVPKYLDLRNDTDDSVLELWLHADGELDRLLSTLPLIDIRKLANNDKNAIVKILNSTHEEFNTLVGSDIVYYTICNFTTKINNDNFKLFIPTEVLDKTKVDTPILKNELFYVLRGASKFITVDETNEFKFDFDAIINEKDVILASNILYASVSNKIIDIYNQSETKTLYVPKSLLTADLNNISSSVWKTTNELEDLLESFNVLEIKVSSLINNTFDPNELSTKILSLDENYDTTNVSKIETLYKSNIIALTLSNTIRSDASLKDKIYVPTTSLVKLDVSEENVISSTEWKNLISGIKVSFDLKSNSNIMEEFKDFNTLINRFFNSNNYSERKEALFKSLILEDTLVNNVNNELNKNPNSDIIVPTILSKDNNKLWYIDRVENKNGELTSLLDILYYTGVGKAFGSSTFIEELTNALQLDKIIYTKNDSLNTNASAILTDKELLQTRLLNSHIISATMINKLITLGVLNIPKEYNLDDIKNQYNSTNIWVSSYELNNLFNSINELKLDIKENNINMDINYILSNNYNIDTICASKVLHLTLSEKIITNNSLYYAKQDIINNSGDKYISKTELSNLLDSIKVLTNNEGIFDINNIKISSLFNDNYEANVDRLFRSNTLQLTIIKIINDTFTSNNMFIIPLELVYNFADSNEVDIKNSAISRYIYNKNNNVFGYNELKHIFDIINELKLAELIDNNAPINLNLSDFVQTSTNTPEQNNSAINKQNKVFNSLLFTTSFVKSISEIGIDVPKTLLNDYDNIKTQSNGYLESNWYTNDEIRKFIKSIEALNIQIVDNKILFDINAYISNLNKNTLATCYSSSITYLTLSNALLESLVSTMNISYSDYIVDVKVYNEKVIEFSEFSNLVLGVKALGFTSFDQQIMIPTLDVTREVVTSNTLRNTISSKIFESLTNIKMLATNNKLTTYKRLDKVVNGYIESTLDYISFDSEEIVNFIDVLNKLGSSGGANFGFEITGLDQILTFDESVFNSNVAVSIINEFIFKENTGQLMSNEQLFVTAMQSKIPGYKISNYDIVNVTTNKVQNENARFVTKDELLQYKTSK